MRGARLSGMCFGVNTFQGATFQGACHEGGGSLVACVLG